MVKTPTILFIQNEVSKEAACKYAAAITLLWRQCSACRNLATLTFDLRTVTNLNFVQFSVVYRLEGKPQARERQRNRWSKRLWSSGSLYRPVPDYRCRWGPYNVLWDVGFFTCVSYAEARNRYRLDVRPSVRTFVRLSVTRWYCIKTAEHIAMISSPHDSPFILVLCISRSSRNSDGVTPAGPLNRGGVWKCRNFRPITRYISETVFPTNISL